jgi:hypothetical protein
LRRSSENVREKHFRFFWLQGENIVMVQQARGTEQILLLRRQEKLMPDESGNRGGPSTVARELNILTAGRGIEMWLADQLGLPSHVLSAPVGQKTVVP